MSTGAEAPAVDPRAVAFARDAAMLKDRLASLLRTNWADGFPVGPKCKVIFSFEHALVASKKLDEHVRARLDNAYWALVKNIRDCGADPSWGTFRLPMPEVQEDGNVVAFIEWETTDRTRRAPAQAEEAISTGPTLVH